MTDPAYILGDRYEVKARIGIGGMGEVYRAFDPRLDRTVAIKILLPQFATDAEYVARFRVEARAAAQLTQPNIVDVHDFGTDGSRQYIVMEFVEGRTLRDFLASGRYPTPEQAVDLTRKIAAALASAHARGIVHRDIKPDNVMVTRDGLVKVMDFGIARIQTDVTASGTSSVIGTAAYLSPEQAQGHPVDARSDIYSLGCTLYELLAGQPPFTGDTLVTVAYKHVNETPTPPSQHHPGVPSRLDAVVMKCLAKDPSNRYQTAEDLIADLERVKQGKAVVLIREAAGVRTVALASDSVTIGRQDDCEVVLEGAGVSHNHALLRFRNGAWTITDLRSTNGTQVNGQAIQSKELADRDKITIGGTEIEFRKD